MKEVVKYNLHVVPLSVIVFLAVFMTLQFTCERLDLFWLYLRPSHVLTAGETIIAFIIIISLSLAFTLNVMYVLIKHEVDK